MADKKISQLTTLAQADVAVTADFLPIVDTSATETKKATPQSVVLGALGATSANVGIGTTSPTQRLHVSGNTLIPISNSYFTFDVRFGIGTPDSDGLQIFSGDFTRFGNRSAGGVFTERMRLDASGNLGIGTASPQHRLDVAYDANATSAVRVVNANAGTSATATLRLETQGNTWTINNNRSGGSLSFSDGGGERARFDNAGNIVAGASVALATNATNGFLYVPTCAGTPTGTPTAITGMAPIVVNTTNNKLYFYSGGAWRDAGP
jgi:hypothetical protein